MSRRTRRHSAEATAVDRQVAVGSLTLSSPVMTASGTAGYGSELSSYVDLSQIGAVVTKSIAPYEWAGNPAPRLHTVQAGMINAVGLQGPGVEYWLQNELPKLLSTGASVVCSELVEMTMFTPRCAASIIASFRWLSDCVGKKYAFWM